MMPGIPEWSREFKTLQQYIPELTQLKIMLIKDYWRGFYEHPDNFRETDLPQIISEWLEREIPKYERDPRGAFVKKKGE